MPSRVLRSLALLTLLVAPALQAQPFTRAGTLGASGPLFNAPNFGTPPTTTANLGQPPTFATFLFDTFSFRVGVAGTYGFNVTAAFDPALYLYRGSFDPSNPLANILIGATTGSLTAGDPSYGPNPGLPFTYALATGTVYVLVTSQFFENAPAGTFTNVITCPQNSCAILPPSNVVVPEPATLVLTAAGMLAIVALRRRSLDS